MRVQINLNPDLVRKIDEYAAAIGQSRSAVCAVWIGQSVLGIERASQAIQAMGIDVAKALEDDGRKNKAKGKSDK